MLVFDSSTLILLAKAEILDNFLDDYEGKVLVPKEVEKESCNSKICFDALLIRKKVQENMIGVVKITDTSLCARLMGDFRIGRGEAEALVLAIERKAKLVATDDKNAIKACKLLRLSFTSAIAILVRLSEKGAIDTGKARAALNTLIKYGRYSGEIVKEVKKRIETK